MTAMAGLVVCPRVVTKQVAGVNVASSIRPVSVDVHDRPLVRSRSSPQNNLASRELNRPQPYPFCSQLPRHRFCSIKGSIFTSMQERFSLQLCRESTTVARSPRLRHFSSYGHPLLA